MQRIEECRQQRDAAAIHHWQGHRRALAPVLSAQALADLDTYAAMPTGV
jgi:hypothetical protein